MWGVCSRLNIYRLVNRLWRIRRNFSTQFLWVDLAELTHRVCNSYTLARHTILQRWIQVVSSMNVNADEGSNNWKYTVRKLLCVMFLQLGAMMPWHISHVHDKIVACTIVTSLSPGRFIVHKSNHIFKTNRAAHEDR